MKKIKIAAVTAALLFASVPALAGQIAALEAFKVCNGKAMQAAPKTLAGGLKIKSVKVERKGAAEMITARFNEVANPDKENQAQLVQRKTGYDFNHDIGGIVFEIDEADASGYLICRKGGVF